MRITSGSDALKACAMVTLVAAVAFATAGCSSAKTGGSPGKPVGAIPASSSAPGSSTGSMTAKSKMAKTDPNAQQCATCSSNKTPVPTNGKVESLKGKQVIKVNITAGTYLPNRFVAKAGTPTTVVFSVRGTAAGCLATPTFKSLNKSVNVPRGTKSLDLGSLAPGTYKFTCSMGVNAGQIVVQ